MANAIRTPRRVVAILVLVVLLAACSGGSESSSSGVTPDPDDVATPSTAEPEDGEENIPALPEGWVEEQVQIDTGLMTVHGTLTRPADEAGAVPAALVIGGSGPTDRDGNSAAAVGSFDTLLVLARWMAEDGVATLRYDKPGSGTTGLGGLSNEQLAAVTAGDFVQMNAALFEALAAYPWSDPDQLSVIGHSEGALFALVLASQHEFAAHVHSLALIMPLSVPILDELERQITAQIDAAEAATALPDDEIVALRAGLTSAIAAVRAGEPVPADLPATLHAVFDPGTIEYLRTLDLLDPVEIAGALAEGTEVAVLCSDADIQVRCEDVAALAAALPDGSTQLTELTGVSHVLKVDDSGSPLGYGGDLPFSPDARQALHAWASG